MAISKSTAVGAFVFGGLGLGIVAILLFGSTHLFATTIRVVVYFQDSVAGLSAGAPVTLRGVKIGAVQSMKVYVSLPDLKPVIPVFLELDPAQVSLMKGSAAAYSADLDSAIKAGLRAQLVPQSLVTGQLEVNLDFHSEIPANVSGNDDGVPEIPSMPSDLQRIKDRIEELKLPELADKARSALEGFQELVGELSGKLGPMASSFQQTSDTARVALESVTETVKTVQGDASRALSSIDRLATTADGQVKTVGQEADRVLTALDEAATRSRTLLDQLNDIAAPRSPMRGDLAAAIRDLSDSASSLRNFSHELERNPSSLLLGRSSR